LSRHARGFRLVPPRCRRGASSRRTPRGPAPARPPRPVLQSGRTTPGQPQRRKDAASMSARGPSTGALLISEPTTSAQSRSVGGTPYTVEGDPYNYPVPCARPRVTCTPARSAIEPRTARRACPEGLAGWGGRVPPFGTPFPKGAFFPDGPAGDDFVLIGIEPARIELMDFSLALHPPPYGLLPRSLSGKARAGCSSTPGAPSATAAEAGASRPQVPRRSRHDRQSWSTSGRFSTGREVALLANRHATPCPRTRSRGAPGGRPADDPPPGASSATQGGPWARMSGWR
jgi:hypothetical protein